MKAPALRERAVAAGVSPAVVEAARDAENQKGELIGLMLEQEANMNELAAAEAVKRAAAEREAKLKAELENARAAAQRTESSDQFTLGLVLDGKVREATNQTTHEKVAAKQHTDLAM